VLLLGFALASPVFVPVYASAGEVEVSARGEADVEYKPVEGPPAPASPIEVDQEAGNVFATILGAGCVVIGLYVLLVLVILTAAVVLFVAIAGSASKSNGQEISLWSGRSEPRGLGAVRNRVFEPPRGLVLLRF
jgi:hypothetical protein